MCRSDTDTVPASAFLTAGVDSNHLDNLQRVIMSRARLLPFTKVTFPIPLVVTKFSFQFFAEAWEELFDFDAPPHK